MHRMKGDISSIFQTVILAVIMGVIIIVSLVLVLVLHFKSFVPFTEAGQIAHSFELIGIFNKPFSLAEGLSSFKPNDRSFFENALETSIVSSLRRADSQNIQTPVKNFLEFFGLESYQVVIEKGQFTLFTVNNLVTPCNEKGTELGICTSRLAGNACGEGRKQLPDASSCSFGQICCSIEISGNVKRCGKKLEGVCTSVQTVTLAAFTCGEGRDQTNDAGLCGPREFCCKYLEASELGFAGKAEIPLVYKGEKVGDMKIETSAR